MVAGHIALDILPDMSLLKPQEVIGAGKVFEIGRISLFDRRRSFEHRLGRCTGWA